MDTTTEELVAIVRRPFAVRTTSGYDMTNTVRKLLRSNPDVDREWFFKNLKYILEREERKIKADIDAIL